MESLHKLEFHLYILPTHDAKGKVIPISTPPHPNYAHQLWTKVQAQLVNRLGVIYLIESVWAMDRCVPVLRSTPERDFLISPSTGPEGSGVTGETGTETHRNY